MAELAPPPPADADGDAAAAVAEDCKRRGNEHFKQGQYEQAIAAYSEAISLRPEEGTFWLNRSIVMRQLERWGDAEQDARRALELSPGNVKALFGRGAALHKLKRLSEALRICEAGLALQADNKALQQLRREVQVEHRAQRRGIVTPSSRGQQQAQAGAPAAHKSRPTRSTSSSSTGSCSSSASAGSRGMGFVNARFGKFDSLSGEAPPEAQQEVHEDGPSRELYACVKAGDAAGCSALLEGGTVKDINWGRPEDGNTALHKAAEEGHVGIVRTLVASGADPEAINSFGLKPVCLAARGSQVFKVLDKLTSPVGETRRAALKHI